MSVEDGQSCIMKGFTASPLYRCYGGDQVKDGEMGRTCNMHDRDQKCAENFSRET
jgi:hypothetical protein